MMPSDSQHISRLRQNIRRLEVKSARLLHIFFNRQPLVRGTVYELRRKCGKPSCRCAIEGKLHPTMVISWNENGRQHLRSLKKSEIAKLRLRTQRYRIFRQARRDLVKLQVEMLALIDELETALRKSSSPASGNV